MCRNIRCDDFFHVYEVYKLGRADSHVCCFRIEPVRARASWGDDRRLIFFLSLTTDERRVRLNMWPLTRLLEKTRSNATAHAATHTPGLVTPRPPTLRAHRAPEAWTRPTTFLPCGRRGRREALQLLRHLRPPFPPTVRHQTSGLRQIPATCLVRIDARLLI